MGSIEKLGCERCGAESADAAAENRPRLVLKTRLADESHFIVKLLTCPDCGQHWVSIFTEMIDWTQGDDAQYWTLLPVTKSESDELLAQGENVSTSRIEQIGSNRRYLQIDYPTGKEKRICWANGHLLIGPHD